MSGAEQRGMLEALGRLARFIAEWGRPAAIVGGVGIVARVRPRLTADIDLVIAVIPSEVEALLALAEKHGWTHDRDELADLLRAGLARLRDQHAGVDLDLMFVDSAFLTAVVSRSSSVVVGTASLPVATVEDLLIMKLEAERPQDIDDILAIKDACAERIDLAYVRSQTDKLGITARLELYFGSL